MSKLFLEEDKLIGHQLIAKRKSLFKKEFYLKGVYYNDLMEDIISNIYEVSSDSLHSEVKQRIEYNLICHLSFRDGGKPVGKTKLKRRINNLELKFNHQFLTRALKIFEEEN